LYNLSHAICYSYGTDNKRGRREFDDGHVMRTDKCLEKGIIQGSTADQWEDDEDLKT